MPDVSSMAVVAEKPAARAEETRAAGLRGLRRWVEWGMLAVAAVFFALHFVHLRADFPNGSPWMDWAKYTDEGWYGAAAIRRVDLGHWNVPGDFNPAAALPVWPVVEWVLFQFTGVSLVAARALTVVVFGGVLAVCYGLVRRWMGARSLAPAAVVLLLAVSPFCFAFFRLAILEPLMILLSLGALLVATEAGRARTARRRFGWAVGLGVVLPLMVLTKTTAVALLPAVVWMVWAAAEFRRREAARVLTVAGVVGGVLWAAYYGLVVRPRYLADYRYLFAANRYTGFAQEPLGGLLRSTVMDGTWLGETVFWAGVAGMACVAARAAVRGWRVNPLGVAMGLWVAGYGAFLFYHANLQPRYYMVLAAPMTVLAVVGLGPMVARARRERGRRGMGVWARRAAAAGVAGVLGFAAVHGAWVTMGFVERPQYTWVRAAERVREAVEHGVAQGRARSRLVLGASASELSLMTGLPSICDDFGSMKLADRVAAYRPGWFAAWNAVEDDKMQALTRQYRLVKVLAVPAFDDPERNLLVLYRLDRRDDPASGRKTVEIERAGTAAQTPDKDGAGEGE